MQIAFDITLRFDNPDGGKKYELWKACIEEAVLLYRKSCLLQATEIKPVPPQVEIGSDDYWHGTRTVVKISEKIKEAEDKGMEFEVTDEVLTALGIEGPTP